MGNETKPDNGPGRPPAAPRGWIRPASAAELGVPPRIKKKSEGPGTVTSIHVLGIPVTNKQSLRNGRQGLWSLICGAAKISFSPVKCAAGVMKRFPTLAGAAS